MAVLSKIWKTIKPVILNKYLITLLAFIIWVTFFDQHNLIERWQTHKEIRALEKEYQYYEGEIKTDKEKMKLLQHDNKYLEKFAREKYHMKSDDEDVFIIKE
ncbi:MAG: septum formation initiator family protein [Paludibacter sp.]|nr:septum formation initiator family protein [Paludibacter sp.]